MKISEIKKEAREALSGKWRKGIVIILEYIAIQMIIAIITILLNRTPVTTIMILLIAESIMLVPLNFAITTCFFKIKRKEDISAKAFIRSIFKDFFKAWRIMTETDKKKIIPSIITVLSVLICTVTIVYSIYYKIFGKIDSIVEPIASAIGLYIISNFWLASVSLSYSLTTQVAYDNKNLSIPQIVKESARLMKGNRCKILLLKSSFLIWDVLSILTLGIGYLWLVQYKKVTMACFYDKVVQAKSLR